MKSKATTKSTVRKGKVTIKSKKTGKTIVSFKKGGLHESLGVPAGKKIPAAKLAQALKSKNPKVKKQAQLAKNMAKWKKK